MSDRAMHAPEVDWARQAPEVYRHEDAAPELAQQDRGYGQDTKEGLNEYGYFSDPRNQPRRLCGLRPRTAISIAILVALIVIGAVVGGTVGGLMAKNRSQIASSNTSISSSPDSPPTTTTLTSPSAASTSPPTSTSTSSAFPTPSNNVLPLNCPAINNTQFTTEGQSFFIYCLVDYKSKSGNVAQSLQPSVNDCIDSCATYNVNNSETPCQGLTFGANLTR